MESSTESLRRAIYSSSDVQPAPPVASQGSFRFADARGSYERHTFGRGSSSGGETSQTLARASPHVNASVRLKTVSRLVHQPLGYRMSGLSTLAYRRRRQRHGGERQASRQPIGMACAA